MSMENIRGVAEKALWIVASAFVVQQYELTKIHHHEALKHTWFYTACTCFTIDVLIFLFLQGYISLICGAAGSDDTIDKKFPVSIPVATLIFVVGVISLNYSLWGVLGFMTPIITFIFFMAFIVVVASIPSAEVKPVEVELLEEAMRKKKVDESKID